MDIEKQKYIELVKTNVETCQTVKQYEAIYDTTNDDGFAQSTFDRAIDDLIAQGIVQNVPKAFGKETGFFPVPKGDVPLGSNGGNI